MKKLIVACVLLSGCATFGTRGSHKEFCGKVATISVSVNSANGFVNCSEAITVTEQAYQLLIEKAGPLRQPWNLEYTYVHIAVDDPLGTTYPADHRIIVHEKHPHSIFHEFLHAFMFENYLGGANQHAYICAKDSWRRADAEYNVPTRYCYFRY